MKILLVNSHYNKESLAEDVISFLSEIPGEWKFELGENEHLNGSQNYNGNPVSWDSFFLRLQNYRVNNNISDETFILLLTEEYNELNWFGMFDIIGRSPHGFVQTSFWEELVTSESIFPILYEIVAIPLQWRMFNNETVLDGNVHKRPIGCINDFCELKRDIILKLQTGNICSVCYKKMENMGIDEKEIDHIDEILDKIRLKFRNFNINRRKRIPAKLILKNHNFYIGSNKLRLSPIQKAIYLFFHTIDKNIRTVEMMDFEDEILDCYMKFYNGSSRDDLVRIAGRIASNEDSLVTQSVSKINSAISRIVIPEIADRYKILTDSEGEKSIESKLEQSI